MLQGRILEILEYTQGIPTSHTHGRWHLHPATMKVPDSTYTEHVAKDEALTFRPTQQGTRCSSRPLNPVDHLVFADWLARRRGREWEALLADPAAEDLAQLLLLLGRGVVRTGLGIACTFAAHAPPRARARQP